LHNCLSADLVTVYYCRITGLSVDSQKY